MTKVLADKHYPVECHILVTFKYKNWYENFQTRLKVVRLYFYLVVKNIKAISVDIVLAFDLEWSNCLSNYQI